MTRGVYKRSKDLGKIISERNKRLGLIPPKGNRKGAHHSEESKKKMSLAKKGNTFFKGKKHSLETIRKIKNNKIKWAKVHKEHYKKLSIAGITKQQNMKEPTGIEKKVYKELKKRGIIFKKQYLINNKFLVDVYIPNLNLIIEADGDYWHSLERVKKKDKAENAYLKKCGFRLLRFSEKEINHNIISLIDQL